MRWAAGLALGIAVSAVSAHDFTVTEVLIVLRSDGTYQIDMRADVDALATGTGEGDSAAVSAQLEALTPGELAAAAERARETITRRVRVRFDGLPAAPVVTFPQFETDEPRPADPVPSVLGTAARLSGRIPEGARELTFFASRAFRPVSLTILDQTALGGVRHMLAPGEESPPYALGGGGPPEMDRLDVTRRYFVLGFTHILPKGADHILFVLGLFLLSTKLKPLFWQVTAFTLAHSITLGLSMYDVVSLSPRIVEPLIALSIAFVAAENLVTSELKPWRPVLVFAFGLLHGLGFAGVLRELGLPEGERVLALLSFNVGVEAGQLAVILAAFVILGWARHAQWYRPYVVIPLSAAIGLVGLYWAIQRAI